MEKLIKYSCIIICALTLFIACSGKGEPLVFDGDSYLSTNVSNLNFKADGGSGDISIASNTLWTVSSSANWLSSSKNSGNGNGTVSVSASANTSSSSRSASIIIAYGQSQQKTISVTQEGKAAEEDVSLKSCPDTKHPHWIDLGLPSGTKWRCCNEGASTPEAYGDYFTFGQVSSAPTKDQIKELVDNCTYEWTTQNGVNGGKFTGPNGGSIFLPATGNSWDDEFYYAGSNGHYWSSSLTESRQDYAWYFYFYSGHVDTNDDYRYFGHSVRPVR